MAGGDTTDTRLVPVACKQGYSHQTLSPHTIRATNKPQQQTEDRIWLPLCLAAQKAALCCSTTKIFSWTRPSRTLTPWKHLFSIGDGALHIQHEHLLLYSSCIYSFFLRYIGHSCNTTSATHGTPLSSEM